MKIALCISGQPRAYEKGYDDIKKYYLDKYNIDVFIHTWKDNIYKGTPFFEGDDKTKVYEYNKNMYSDLVGLYNPKSFLIDKPEGGKLEYGVLEGQQNDVFYRGELKGDNVIYLPQEWEWLVDENTITIQLTSIGKHQELYIKEIKENKIFIDINGVFKTKENIHCYYIIHGTRKDIELIRNHQ